MLCCSKVPQKSSVSGGMHAYPGKFDPQGLILHEAAVLRAL